MEFILLALFVVGFGWVYRQLRAVSTTVDNLCAVLTYQATLLSFYGNLVNRMLEQHGVPMQADERPDVGAYDD